MAQRLPPSKSHPDLDVLLARAKSLPPMTRAQYVAQRHSWVRGELGLLYPNKTIEEIESIIKAGRFGI